MMKIMQWFKVWINSLPVSFSTVALGVATVIIIAIPILSGDSKEERDAKAYDERAELINAISTASAEKLEAQLKELRDNGIYTEKIIQTETIKPVFTNVCATDEYVKLLNESIERAENTLSGHIDNKMSGQVTAPAR